MGKSLWCIKCGTRMQKSILKRYFVNTYDGNTILCENVPVDKCPSCGEIYFPSQVAERFEKIRKNQLKNLRERKIRIPTLVMAR